MEYLLGIIVVGLLLAYAGIAVQRPGGTIDRLGRTLFLIANLSIFLIAFMDWGHGSATFSALDLALVGHPLPLLPGALALIQLLLWARRQWDAIWTLFSLSVLTFVLFIPALVFAEDQLLESGAIVSFFAPAPVLGLVLAAIAPLLAAPAVAHKIPGPETRLWRVAFARRQPLLHAIRAIGSEPGWLYSEPLSILEGGSARGSWDDHPARIETRPSLFPFRYTVRLTLHRPSATSPAKMRLQSTLPPPLESALSPLRDETWMSRRVWLIASEDSLSIEYRSPTDIPLDEAALRRIFALLAAAVPA